MPNAGPEVAPPAARVPTLKRLLRWIGIAGASVLGSVGALACARHVVGLFFLVTIGPFASALPASEDGLTGFAALASLGVTQVIGRDGVLLAGLVLAIATVALGRLLPIRHDTASAVTRVAIGLALVAFSYRLLGLVALGAAVALEGRTAGSSRSRWIACIVVAGLCLAPMDVSMRPMAGGPRWAESVHCSTEETLQLLRRGELDSVCTQFGQSLYYEPKWVWVW